MREIKFRAWDKLSKQWVPGGYGFHVLGEALLIGGLFQNMPLEMLNDIELMQFTGLRDKNGKEIYEGDIIACQDCSRLEVKFSDGSFVAGYMRIGQTDVGTSLVIGNIHENPELIFAAGADRD